MDIRCSRIEKLQSQLRKEKIDYYIIPTSDFHNSEYVGDYFKIREWYSGLRVRTGLCLLQKILRDFGRMADILYRPRKNLREAG